MLWRNLGSSIQGSPSVTQTVSIYKNFPPTVKCVCMYVALAMCHGHVRLLHQTTGKQKVLCSIFKVSGTSDAVTLCSIGITAYILTSPLGPLWALPSTSVPVVRSAPWSCFFLMLGLLQLTQLTSALRLVGLKLGVSQDLSCCSHTVLLVIWCNLGTSSPYQAQMCLYIIS